MRQTGPIVMSCPSKLAKAGSPSVMIQAWESDGQYLEAVAALRVLDCGIRLPRFKNEL
jgi:hypothetical protein